MLKKLQTIILFTSLILVITTVPTLYAQSSSNNYSIQEQFIGTGGAVDDGSTNYSGRDTIGDNAIGDSGVSDGNRLQSGYVTDGEPRLAFIVNTSSLDLGGLSTVTAKTGNATFSVLNYTSYGYVVQAFGDPPSSGSHVLSGMSSTDASQTGVEQFGINLRANTSPVTFGADPVQVPDNTFSFGGAAGGYSTANQFRYVPGETVASATQSSGQTNYTVSYIVNISSVTPGGNYTGKQGFICVGTY